MSTPRLRLAPVHGSQSDGARRRLSVLSVFPALRRSLGARTLTNISGLTNLKVEPCRRLASVGPPCAGARRTAQGVGSAWGRRSCTVAVPNETLFVRRFVGRSVVLRAVPEETLLVRLFVGRLVILRAVPTETLFVRLFVGRSVILRAVNASAVSASPVLEGSGDSSTRSGGQRFSGFCVTRRIVFALESS